MLMPSSEWSAAITARIGRMRGRQRYGPVALPPTRARNPRGRRHDRVEVPRDSPAGREWDARVAREVSHQARIEAAFDRADECERLGDFRCALEWLGRAEDLCGGLPPEYRARRARWADQLTRHSPYFAVNGTGSVQGFAFEIRGGPEAGCAARQAALASNGALPGAVRADVLLLVTDLVNNAMRHAGVRPMQVVRVELRRLPQGVRVEVTDRGGRVARVHPRSNGDEAGGWGLLLVDRIADRWGARPTASGTCVWFEVRPEEDADASE
jgi:anti-sigma regulatory factor (Ser/Thr protein kinase)